MSLFLCGVGKISSRASIWRWYFFFHILILQEYLVLTESRIPLKPVLGACELLHFQLVLMNILNKTESDVFL